jgi:hypothetical protein
MSTTTSDFYVIGGTLRRDAPSYVTRQADEDLYNGVSGGHFCYVLTSRQMGKSSLMVRTAVRLRTDGVSVAVLDLTALGQNVNAEQWYQGLLELVGDQLNLEDELGNFWLANKQIGPLQRWMRAIREVVLTNRAGRLVIFVDEIDAVRSLPFSTDEFFAGIREFYNRRTVDPEIERLTFGLLGVATPSNLIRDTRTTPFNIGRRIELTDFTDVEAAPLAQGFGQDKSVTGRMLARILYWTGGHPYLTQRLCQAVAEQMSVLDAKGVDRVCKSLFMSARARERDDNLLFVRERLLRSEDADRASLLDLYARIHRKRHVRDDETNPLVSALRLSGIIRARGGYLHVRNRIYARVFDREWILATMPDAELRRQRAAYRRGLLRAASIAAVVLLLMVGLASAALYQRRDALAQKRLANQRAEELGKTLDQLRAAVKTAEDRRLEAERNQKAAVEAEKRASEDAVRARIAERQAADNARRAEEQKKIAEQNESKAKNALIEARQSKEAAQESERRLRKQSIQSYTSLYNVATRLESVAPLIERPRLNWIKGSAQMQLHNYESAINDYTSTLNEEPDNGEVLISRSYLYLVTGEPQKAIDDANAALKINPASFIARLNLSIALGFAGQYREGEVNLEQAIANFTYNGSGEYPQSYVAPEIVSATGRSVINADGKTALAAFHYELATLRAGVGGEGFAAALERASHKNPNQNAYLFALNWALMNYEHRKEDFGLRASQGALWEKAGFERQALDAYLKFQEEQKQHPDDRRYDVLAKWVETRLIGLKGHLPGSPATQSYEEKLAEDLYLDGLESRSSGRSNTINFWSQALQKDPENVNYLIDRAGFLYDRKDFIGTRLDCDAALQRAPRTATAYLYRAMANVSAELNAPDAVIVADIRKAKELDPTVVPASYDPNLVKLSELLAKSDLDEAVGFLERVGKNNYPSAEPYALMARLLNEKNRHKEALEKIKIAIMIGGNETGLFDERRKAEEGLCLKDTKSATCPYQAEIVRRQTLAYRGIGDARLRLGLTGGALDIYTTSLRLLNDLPDIKSSPAIQRDISVTLSTIASIVEENGSRRKAIDYLRAEFSEMNNLKDSLNGEISRLSNSP